MLRHNKEEHYYTGTRYVYSVNHDDVTEMGTDANGKAVWVDRKQFVDPDVGKTADEIEKNCSKR